jgi:phosphate transport system permease protein
MSGLAHKRNPDGRAAAARERRRLLADGLARHVVTFGGLAVILAVVLIGFYLFYVVLPLLQPARLTPGERYPAPGGPAPARALALDERAELGLRIASDSRAIFFRVGDGQVVQVWQPPPGTGAVTGLTSVDPTAGLYALGMEDGRVLVVGLGFEVEYGAEHPRVRPRVDLPFGPEPFPVASSGAPVEVLALRVAEEGLTAAVALAPAVVEVVELSAGGLVDGAALEPTAARRLDLPAPARQLALSADGRWLHAATIDGRAWSLPLTEEGAAWQALVPGSPVGAGPGDEASRPAVTALRMLVGGTSVLLGDAEGGIAQWFPVRREGGGERLERVRTFPPLAGPVRDIAPEQRRRGFLAVDATGGLGVYYTTSGRRLLAEPLAGGPLARVAVAPRGDALLAEDDTGQLHFRRLDNPHPEVSWSALWGAVWYEGHERPQYKWQSTGATSDVEPKLSLTPLTFGTLKAALYAMLLSIPLAVAGAIYTAHFMDPRLRGWAKPTIEVMEALPTVILGFLAGLWLSPYVEANLPGVVSALLLVPLSVVAFGWAWQGLPGPWRARVPPGREPLLLLPVVVASGWAGLALGAPLEEALFGGDLRTWLTRELGVDFDQRNAIVVGIAMGFAVIPNIFSIAEDAVFGVPRHLVHGSLALGATAWQTVARVVLPTASSGIFSAVMIGFGRAVGETMIVLMATGNTPVIDPSPFLGMRTLAANVAIEMPESDVGGTHYRLLFLAALVLFLFTFALNTVAEAVRHRLRRRYSAL